MKRQPPVLTPEAIAAAASSQTKKAKRKLSNAKAELQASNAVLEKHSPRPAQKEIDAALKHNHAAEEKVDEATDELEVAAELLNDAMPKSEAAGAAPAPATGSWSGKTGQGAKSAIEHLRKQIES